jgi:hypothetical protein
MVARLVGFARLAVYSLIVRSRFPYGVTCSELMCTPDCV